MQRFAKNSIALVVASLSVMVLGAVYRIFIARYLGDAEFGKYTFIVTYFTYFTAFSLLGLRQVIVRESAKSPERYQIVLHESLKIRGISTLFAFAAACVIIPFLGKGADVNAGVIIISLSLFAMAVMDTVEAMIVAREASEYVTISSLVSNLLKIVSGIYLLERGYGLISVLLLYTAISGLNAVLSWAFFRYAFRTQATQEIEHVSKFRRFLFHESMPFFYTNLISRVYYKNDMLILSFLKGDRVLGWYGAAYLSVDALLNTGWGIINAALPVMSRLYGNDKDRLKYFHSSLSRYLMVFFLAIAVVITAVGPEVMTILLGEKYSQGAPALRILGWMPAAELITVGLGTLLTAAYKQSLIVRMSLVNAVINLGLCLSLIPKFSYIGAAVGTVVSSYITLLIVMVVVSRTVYKMDWLQMLVKPTMCALLSTLALFYLRLMLGCWVGLAAALVCYGVLLIVTGTIGSGDYRVVKSIVKREPIIIYDEPK